MGPAREEKGALVWGQEAVTQGWKGVNPAVAWQAGSGVCAGAGKQGPSCIPGGIFGGSVGAWWPGFPLYPLTLRFNQGWASLGFQISLRICDKPQSELVHRRTTQDKPNVGSWG